MLAWLRGRWRALTQGAQLDRELDEEMQFHLDMEIEKHRAAGLSPAEARRVALVSFGGVTQTAEAHRAARGTRLLEDLIADCRYAVRGLARAPGYVTTCILTLAMPIAICTLLANGVTGFFFRPLPVPGGGDLVRVFTSDYSSRERPGASSYADILDFAAAAAPVADIVGDGRVMFAVGTRDEVVMAQGAIVTPGYFTMLQVRPALGRFPDRARPDAPEVVLSYTLWRRTFAADSTLIGRSVLLNGQPFTVVAVADPAFRGTSREFANDFWIEGTFAPLVQPREDVTRERGARRFHALARLRDDAPLGALEERLGIVAAGLAEQHPEAWIDGSGQVRRVSVMRERAAHLANIPRAAVLLVLGAVFAIGVGLLVVASANLVSLQLARSAARRREIATRLALGAGRARLVRQLLTESALVVLPGAVAGVLTAVIAARLISHYRPIPLPSIDLALDWRALGVIAGALAVVLTLFGLVPALQSVRSDLHRDLGGSGRPGLGGARVGRARGALIVGQVALSVVFTALSTLVAFALIRDARQGRESAQHVLVAQVNFLPSAGDSAQVRALTDHVLREIGAYPGVQRASASDFIPVRGSRRTVAAEVTDADGTPRRLELDANAVKPGYFAVVGIPVLRGRDFEPLDEVAGESVVIVSRAMADALWPSQDPVGQLLTIERRLRSERARVVGVVADPAGQGPATPLSFPGLLYLPWRSIAEAELILHVRTAERQSAIAWQIAEFLRYENPRLVAGEVMTLERYYDEVVMPQRAMAYGAGALAVLQLVFAVAGLAGLVAYVTSLRRREVGILTALGASRGAVLRLVLRQGVTLAAIGALVGLALSLAASQIVVATLPVTVPMLLSALLIAAVVFSVTAGVAMLLPARRALSVTPAEALRMD